MFKKENKIDLNENSRLRCFCFYYRQCLCVFRDAKNFERFSNFSQAVIYLGILELKDLLKHLLSLFIENSKGAQDISENTRNEIGIHQEGERKIIEENRETWDLQEKEKLLNFISKLFLLNFPLYQVRRNQFDF